MFKKESTKKLMRTLHGTVWGTMDMKLNECQMYDGYETDAVRMYEELAKELYEELL